MKRIVLVLGLMLVSVALFAADTPPTATEIARRSFDAVAGSAWDQARYVAFTFNVDRDGKNIASFSHRWDRWTGDYRVEGKDRDGKQFVIVMNVNTKQGKAWVDGVEQTDNAELLKRGYGRFINDTYWLLMPAKMLDPGVKLEYAGTKHEADGRTLDGVKLSFENVGLTPGDQYWVWVDRKTGLVELWQMQLEGMKPEDPKREHVFREYQKVGGLTLSMSKPSVDGKMRIWFSGVDVRKDVPKGAFEK